MYVLKVEQLMQNRYKLPMDAITILWIDISIYLMQVNSHKSIRDIYSLYINIIIQSRKPKLSILLSYMSLFLYNFMKI